MFGLHLSSDARHLEKQSQLPTILKKHVREDAYANFIRLKVSFPRAWHWHRDHLGEFLDATKLLQGEMHAFAYSGVGVTVHVQTIIDALGSLGRDLERLLATGEISPAAQKDCAERIDRLAESAVELIDTLGRSNGAGDFELKRVTDPNDPILPRLQQVYETIFPAPPPGTSSADAVNYEGYSLDVFREFLEDTRSGRYGKNEWFMLYALRQGEIAGFYYVFYLVQQPTVNYIMDYYIGVPDYVRDRGIGSLIVKKAYEEFFHPAARAAGFPFLYGRFGEIEREDDEPLNPNSLYKKRVAFFRGIGGFRVDIDYQFPDIGAGGVTDRTHWLTFTPVPEMFDQYSRGISIRVLFKFLEIFFQVGYEIDRPRDTIEFQRMAAEMKEPFVRLVQLE